MNLFGLIVLSAVCVLIYFLYKNSEELDECLKRGEMDNEEIARYDGINKLIIWGVIIATPVMALLIPFRFLHWSTPYQYYLLGLIPYTAMGILVAKRAHPHLKKNIQIARMGMVRPVAFFCLEYWPLMLFLWHKLEEGISEFERIKHSYHTYTKKKAP